MRLFNSPVPGHLRAGFRAIEQSKLERIAAALRDHYFADCPEGYLATDWGRDDLDNHILGRLETAREMIVPWLDAARPLQGSAILEIGCGTGCSTVALAEQGAKVTALDADEGSLVVAAERCSACGLDVSFVRANAAQADTLFSDHRFDFIIFYASLEHMTLEERISAMRASWNMLSSGGFWVVIEAPNRLWFYDSHTSLLPFHMWLPDDLAFAYSRFSPRYNYRELYRTPTDESKLHFLRRGRGVSYHEFELAMKPLGELRVRSCLTMAAKEKGTLRRVKRMFSKEHRYLSLLRKIVPEVHEGFLQDFLYLILEKD
ncbi:MAG TPA: class I SAM-dependent methyltransferase [Thermoanaerobaculia bacterium]|nr:class I SAM-dependent methyltransferase [Thermoanaerobaculia bacterium]